VGFPPGGGTDILARILAQKLSVSWGQQVVVENRPGASATIGANAVAKAAPDGYTLSMGQLTPNAIAPALTPNPPYDALRDFAPIVLVGTSPNVLAVYPGLSGGNAAELVALAKSKPSGYGIYPPLAALRPTRFPSSRSSAPARRCTMCGYVASRAAIGEKVSYSKKAKFEEVRDEVKLAIEAKGLVIDYQSYVNRMLERTGKDVGSAKKLYADAQAFVFCSAALSRKTMEADPANMSLCPYSISVYATAANHGTVVVSYRRPWRPDGSAASKAALKEVEALLDSIAREALGIRK